MNSLDECLALSLKQEVLSPVFYDLAIRAVSANYFRAVLRNVDDLALQRGMIAHHKQPAALSSLLAGALAFAQLLF